MRSGQPGEERVHSPLHLRDSLAFGASDGRLAVGSAGGRLLALPDGPLLFYTEGPMPAAPATRRSRAPSPPRGEAQLCRSGPAALAGRGRKVGAGAGAMSGSAALENVSQRIGLAGTRHDLVFGYTAEAKTGPGERLASVGALVHRLERG